jgi:hypothetical protein
VTPRLLTDLADLFSIEAHEADKRGNTDEADRLYDVADALDARALELEKEP